MKAYLEVWNYRWTQIDEAVRWGGQCRARVKRVEACGVSQYLMRVSRQRYLASGNARLVDAGGGFPIAVRRGVSHRVAPAVQIVYLCHLCPSVVFFKIFQPFHITHSQPEAGKE